jgi:membrane associated rhomboid family serine protease
VFGWRHGGSLPDGPVRFLRWRLLPWLVVNLVLGLALPQIIDNAGHVGGLVTGTVLASVMGNRITPGEEGTVVTRGLTWAASLVLLAGGAWGVAAMWR